jgi:D-tyrosyl-tRNA(Tyr) deacylase
MRVVYQRVSRAAVSANGLILGQIGPGACLLVGFTQGDGTAEVDWMADKVAGLRVFADGEGKMNLSLVDTGGAVLVVSQFTLYGDASRGRRPSFIGAARPEEATPLYQAFVEGLRARGLTVATGEFGALMAVELVNDGPVTLLLEREAGRG